MENKKHVVIITGQHMVANPRVWKEANSLFSNNYKVTILTTLYNEEYLKMDRQLLLPGISLKGNVNQIKNIGSFNDRFISKIKRRLALYLKKFINLEKKDLLVYSFSKQVRLCLKENADLYIAHQEAGLLVGNALLKLGKKVAIDMEDWYSKDYLNNLRPIKLLKKEESFGLANAAFVTCPSESMAESLMQTYKLLKKPFVIYNGFTQKESEGISFSKSKLLSFVWFSQVIGPERGLENAIEQLDRLKTACEIHLYGRCMAGYDIILKKILKDSTHCKLFIHEKVPHNQLIKTLSSFTVGLAVENKFPESRNVTVTNKILQYIQAGLKVWATDTTGQKEILKFFPDSLYIIKENDFSCWEKAYNNLNTDDYNYKKAQLDIFNTQFSWEVQEIKLLKVVDLVCKQKLTT